MRQWIAQRPQTYQLVATVEDVRCCKEQGKLGIVFDIESMCPVQKDLSLVQSFYELGVRWMLVAYNRNNAAGGGCLDDDNGLTAFGRAIVDPPGLDARMLEPEAIGAIVEGLARDNLTDNQIRGIIGENWLRIAAQVWR